MRRLNLVAFLALAVVRRAVDADVLNGTKIAAGQQQAEGEKFFHRVLLMLKKRKKRKGLEQASMVEGGLNKDLFLIEIGRASCRERV